MTLATRRILYITFILLFLVITPLVIAFAAGYQFTFSLNRPLSLQKTGMLILDTMPRGARIYINGKPEQKLMDKYVSELKVFGARESFITTPAKIKNLLPGEYDVRMVMDGYWGWNKKLTVRGGESTYAEDVFLFRNNLPLLLINAFFRDVAFSPDKRMIGGVSGDEFIAAKQDDDSTFRVKLATSTDSYSWSAAGRRILSGNRAYAVDGSSAPIDLEGSVAGVKAENFKWSQDNDNMVYYQAKDDKNGGLLGQLDLSNLATRTIALTDEIADYFAKGGNYYVINKIGSSQKLNVFDSAQNIVASFDLIKPYDYGFINPQSSLINLYNRKKHTLYLINPNEKFRMERIIDNVDSAFWTSDGKLLYSNAYEIWLLDPSTGQDTLLTRISSPIRSVILHPSKNYVLFATDNSINTIELDDREKRNITELIKLDHISSAQLNARGDAIYFLSKIGNQEGLYKLLLQ